MNSISPFFANKDRLNRFVFHVSYLLMYPFTHIFGPITNIMMSPYIFLTNYRYTSPMTKKGPTNQLNVDNIIFCEAWATSAPFEDFVSKEKSIDNKNKLSSAEKSVVNACREASDANVKVLGLGWLAKAEWILNGGSTLLEQIKPCNKTKFVHGNTLTTGVVINKLTQFKSDKINISNEWIYLIGSTSKIGRALVIYLLKKGYKVIMFTTDTERYEKIKSETANKQCVQLSSSLDDMKKYKVICIGKYLDIKKYLPKTECVVVDFTVPSVIVPKNNKITYIDATFVGLNKDLTDNNYSLAKNYNEMYCCQAGAMVHTLEKWDHHELGPIDIDKIDSVVDAAKRHGFIF